MLAAVKGFHEEPAGAKAAYYSRDTGWRVRYWSNFDLFQSPAACWRDTLFLETAPELPPPEEIPPSCRNIALEYARISGGGPGRARQGACPTLIWPVQAGRKAAQPRSGVAGGRVQAARPTSTFVRSPPLARMMQQLGRTLLELLSEALGLRRGHLEEDATCLERLAGHYYPPCPEPQLTLGTTRHSDPCFLAVLLQDAVGGLQVLLEEDHDGNNNKKKPSAMWVDVPTVEDALVVNVGDFLQLVSNDRFRSVEHRVVSQSIRPRISVACFFRRHDAATSTRVLAPIVGNGEARYRSTTMAELIRHNRAKGLDGSSALQHLRL